LLRLNLQIVLEKVRTQENELQAMRKQAAQARAVPLTVRLPGDEAEVTLESVAVVLDPLLVEKKAVPGAAREVEDALKALREAQDKVAPERLAVGIVLGDETGDRRARDRAAHVGVAVGIQG
jgi:hypothetical protein